MDFIQHKVFELEGTSEISSFTPSFHREGNRLREDAICPESHSKPGTQPEPLPSGTIPSQGSFSKDCRQLNSIGLTSWKVLWWHKLWGLCHVPLAKELLKPSLALSCLVTALHSVLGEDRSRQDGHCPEAAHGLVQRLCTFPSGAHWTANLSIHRARSRGGMIQRRLPGRVGSKQSLEGQRGLSFLPEPAWLEGHVL